MGILEHEVAIPFDMECNEVLTQWERERDEVMIEAVAMGGAVSVGVSAVNPKLGRPTREITSANFGDQGF